MLKLKDLLNEEDNLNNKNHRDKNLVVVILNHLQKNPIHQLLIKDLVQMI